MINVLIKRGKVDTEIPVDSADNVKRHNEKTHLKLRRMAGTNPSLTSSEGINPFDTLILDFQTLELGYNTFRLFKPPSLWHCVTAVFTN